MSLQVKQGASMDLLPIHIHIKILYLTFVLTYGINNDFCFGDFPSCIYMCGDMDNWTYTVSVWFRIALD